MALTTHPLPFGLRKIHLFPLDASGTRIAAASKFLPASRTLTFSEAVDSEDLEAEDSLYASHQSNLRVEWELEGGGVSLDILKILTGGAIVASGTTPNQKNVFTKLKIDERTYFDIEGQVISDSGGDPHADTCLAIARHYRACEAAQSWPGRYDGIVTYEPPAWAGGAGDDGFDPNETAGE